MLGIKGKIFIPLAAILLSVAFYLHSVWIPAVIGHAKAESLNLLQHTLEIVDDEITQSMVDNKMDAVAQRLDLILLKNPDWKHIVLEDMNGRKLFPQEQEEAAAPEVVKGAIMLSLQRQVIAYDKPLGMIKVDYDFTEGSRQIEENARRVLLLVISSMLLFSVLLTAILYRFVIRPAEALASAAGKVANADTPEEMDAITLPRATHDEIGSLVTKFARMRDMVRDKQEHLKLKNHELEHAREKAEAASLAKSQFLANMSHELRTPLHGIIGLTRLLCEGEMHEDQRESAQAILRSGESLLYMLNDVLDFSKIEANELILEETPFNLKGSIQNVIYLLSPMASKKGLVLDYKYNVPQCESVVGDPLRVGQIVTNLIGNAIKFTEKGTITISVSARAMEENPGQFMFFIVIRDTGIGITPEQQARLFQKFSQADASTTRKYGGSGLGLAISKNLVDLMKGSISCESVPEKGSIFTAKIPLMQADKPVSQTSLLDSTDESIVQRLHDYSQFRVLVVDDHPTNMLFARKQLKKMGFTMVDEAMNGAVALERIAANRFNPYHIILMDCQMPEMDGFEACRRLRELEGQTGTHVPVVAMTAHAMEGDRERCLNVGMDDYLSKPISPVKLEKTLQYWLFKIGGEKGERHAPSQEADNVVPLSADPVNLHQISLITDNVPEQEMVVADTFFEVSQESLDILRKHLENERSAKDWRDAAHKLRGAAAQLGATFLADACKKAYDSFDGDIRHKASLLKEIEAQYKDVQKFLTGRRKA